MTCVIALARAVKPHKIRLFTKPDQLASRVSPILLDDERACLRLAAHAVEHLHHLSIDETAERSHLRRNATREEPSLLVDDAVRELVVDASRDALGGQLRRQPQR